MDRQEWLKQRRAGIGGSDVAAIIGISKWRTALDVYNSKIGDVEDVDNESKEWGRRLEPVVRQAYADKTGRSVKIPGEMFRSAEHPFMIANLDGLCEDRVVEIKTAGTSQGWGESGTDEIPDYYLTQVQHYMTVTGKKLCDVAVLIGTSDFRVYTIEHDPELEALIVKAEETFWKHVEQRIPPEPRTLEDCKAAFPQSVKAEIEADEQVASALSALTEVRKRLAELKASESTLLAKIQTFMKDNDTLTLNGSVAATWKSGKPVARLDSAALKAAMPDVYAQFLKAGAPIRRFTLKSLSEE